MNRSVRIERLTHFLHFRPTDDGTGHMVSRPPIRVTEKQVDAWKKARDLKVTLTLRDDGFGEILYCGDPWAITEATTIKPPKTYLWICDFKEKHTLNEECDCYRKFGVPSWVHRERKEAEKVSKVTDRGELPRPH